MSEVLTQQEKSLPKRRFFKSGDTYAFDIDDIEVTITEENIKNQTYNRIVRQLQWQK